MDKNFGCLQLNSLSPILSNLVPQELSGCVYVRTVATKETSFHNTCRFGLLQPLRFAKQCNSNEFKLMITDASLTDAMTDSVFYILPFKASIYKQRFRSPNSEL